VVVRDLRVAEAALTGESVPVEKAAALPTDTPLADRKNLAFASSLVTFGSAKGLVVETGDRTEVGKISGLIQSAQGVETPLTREIARFSHWLLYVILGVAGLTIVVGLLRGEALKDMFHAAVALAVAAIPEGLPAAVTIVLAVGVARMARRNAIIRRLPAVETLGSTSVICSDKTGTLTENQMTVQRVHAAGRVFRVSGVGYAPTGEVTAEDGGDLPEAVRECLTAGVLCNDSVLVSKDDRWEIQDDPTEGALLVAARKLGLSADALATERPGSTRSRSSPSSSTWRRSTTAGNTSRWSTSRDRSKRFWSGVPARTPARSNVPQPNWVLPGCGCSPLPAKAYRSERARSATRMSPAGSPSSGFRA
jgi:Ca2+-transporting ATPase